MKTLRIQSCIRHTVARLSISVMVALFAISCTKSDPEPELDPRLQCDWPKESTIVETLTDEIGMVVKTKNGDRYQIMMKDKLFSPCNLSTEAQIDSLPIVVSGYVITYPLNTPKPSSGPSTAPMTLAGTPFEITDLAIK